MHNVKQQQGSALVWLVSLTMIVGMLALVVDASMLYFEKRKLQSIANEVVSAIGNMNKACSRDMDSIDLKALESAAEAQIIDPKIRVQEVDFLNIETVNGVHKASSPLEESARSQSNGITVLLEKDFGGFFPFLSSSVGALRARSTLKKEVIVAAELESKIEINTANSPILNLILGKILGVSLSVTTDLSDLANSVTDVSKLLENLLALDVPLNAIPIDDLLKGVLWAVDQPLQGVGNGLDEIINKAANINKNIDLEHVIKGVSSADIIPKGAKINTLSLVQSIIFNTDNALPKEVEISSSDLLGFLGDLGVGSTEVKLKITPTPAYLVSAVVEDENGDFPYIESNNIDLKLKLALLDVPVVNMLVSAGIIDLNLKVGSGTFELNEISSCGLGSNNVVEDVGGQSYGSLFEIEANILALKLVLGVAEVEACFSPNNSSSTKVENKKSIDLSTNNYPIALEVNPNINPLENVSNLLGSLGLNLKVFGLGRTCRPGEALGLPSNDIFNDLSSVLRVLDENLINPILSVLGADLASQDLIIESLAQQSVLIEGEVF